ncbi:MAG TPA: hypothetical protein VHU40_13345, partial [Polyangia bacterium]|nr:hypothetical protein [Polyangia bacterium]
MDPVTARTPATALAAFMVCLLALAVGCGGSGESADGTGGRGGGAAGRGGFHGGLGGKGGSAAAGGGLGTGGLAAGGSYAIGGGEGGANGFGGHGGSAGLGGSSGGCVIALQPVSPASFNDIEAGPDVTLTVKAQAVFTLARSVVWRWQVTTSDGLDIPAKVLD